MENVRPPERFPGRTPGNWEQVLEVDGEVLPAGGYFWLGKAGGGVALTKDSLGWRKTPEPYSLPETSSFPQVPFSLEAEEPGIRDDFGA